MYFIRRWLYLVPLIFLAFPAHSAVVIDTVKTGSGTYTPNGNIRMPFTFEGATPNTPSTFTQAKPAVPKGLALSLAKKALKGGWASVAISGAISSLSAGIDFIIENGEIRKKEDVYTGGSKFARSVQEKDVDAMLQSCIDAGLTGCRAVPTGGSYYTHAIFYGGEKEEQIIDLAPEDWEVLENAFDESSPSTQSTIINNYLQNTAMPSVRLDSPSLPAPQNANKQELQDILDNAPYPVLSNDSQTQDILQMWPELKTAMQQLANIKLAQQISTINTELELTPDQQAVLDNSELTLPDTDQDITVEVPPLELPPFCEWAGFICEPFVGGEHPPVPINQIEIPEYDSGLPSTGQCPDPVTFELSIWGSHEISFQPACDLAEAIKLPLLAISYLLAGYIVVGVRR